MKNSYLLTLSLLFIILCSHSEGIQAQPNWSYLNTGNNHTIVLAGGISILLNGVQIEPGDYIGVFYYDDNNDLACGGYTEYTGASTAISAWGDDTFTTSVKDGFDTGEVFKYKIWDASTQQSVIATASYSSGPDNYAINAISILAAISSNVNILYTINSISCNGASDGGIEVNPVFGQTPYTYLWSSGTTFNSVNSLSAGVYTVTVTDALSAVDSISIAISEPNVLISNILVNEANAFQCMASAQAYGSGGTSPYSYLWDDPATQSTSLADSLCPGTYSVLVSDDHGCINISSAMIQQNSGNVIDSAFTLLDTCLVNSILDTAFISDLFYSATVMMIEWTLVSIYNDTAMFTTPYPTITTPGVFYVGLTIICPTKSGYTIQLVQVIEITQQHLRNSEQQSVKDEYELYPNPVRDRLLIGLPPEMSAKQMITIYNVAGMLMYRSEHKISSSQSKLNIDVNKFPNGTYFVQINGSRHLSFIKLN
jgi:hypothetical protein